jgi:hypothetical protein
VTDGARRVAALAAVLAPARAGALLARLPEAGAPESAAALAAAPRQDRLRALAGALAADPGEARARAEGAAAAERPRIAALLRALAAGEPTAPAASSVLMRLCRETIGR